MPKWSLVNSKALCRDSITARILEYCSQLANPIYFFSLVKGMNKTKNIQNKNKKLFVYSVAIVVALALITSPLISMDDAFATKGKKGNKATQSIDQSQSSNQNGLCVSGVDTWFSCNNASFQHQFNSGNNALAQSGKGGNSAEQSISQSQSSNQGSVVVSGGNTVGSGNNFNSQSQTNTGNNVAAQS